jgi:hypothetical protein
MDQFLLTVAALACPIAIGVMVWMMMHGNHGAATTDLHEIKRLQAEIDKLKSKREPRADIDVGRRTGRGGSMVADLVRVRPADEPRPRLM